MLSTRCYNSRKSENTPVSELNCNLYLEICQKHDTSLQYHETLVVLVLFTVYILLSFFVLEILELAERHFSSNILVPFPDSGVLYSYTKCTEKTKEIYFEIKQYLFIWSASSWMFGRALSLPLLQMYLCFLLLLNKLSNFNQLQTSLTVPNKHDWYSHKIQ